MTKRPLSPCLDCEDRSAECHATCERYLKFVEENDEWKHGINEEKKKNMRPIWSHSQYKKLVTKNKNVKRRSWK